MDPPVSDPSAAVQRPAMTAAPEPPLEPPTTRPTSQGLQVGGVTVPQANSCIRVLPVRTAPAARKRATAFASWFGNEISGALVPAVVGMSRVV